MFEDRVQTTSADILGCFIDLRRHRGDRAHRLIGETNFKVLSRQQRGVLTDQRVFGLPQNSFELVGAKRLELDPDRKAPLHFGYEICRT